MPANASHVHYFLTNFQGRRTWVGQAGHDLPNIFRFYSMKKAKFGNFEKFM